MSLLEQHQPLPNEWMKKAKERAESQRTLILNSGMEIDGWVTSYAERFAKMFEADWRKVTELVANNPTASFEEIEQRFYDSAH